MKQLIFILLLAAIFSSSADAQNQRTANIVECYVHGADSVLKMMKKKSEDHHRSFKNDLMILGGPRGFYRFAESECDRLLDVSSDEKKSKTYCDAYGRFYDKMKVADFRFWQTCKDPRCGKYRQSVKSVRPAAACGL